MSDSEPAISDATRERMADRLRAGVLDEQPLAGGRAARAGAVADTGPPTGPWRRPPPTSRRGPRWLMADGPASAEQMATPVHAAGGGFAGATATRLLAARARRPVVYRARRRHGQISIGMHGMRRPGSARSCCRSGLDGAPPSSSRRAVRLAVAAAAGRDPRARGPEAPADDDDDRRAEPIAIPRARRRARDRSSARTAATTRGPPSSRSRPGVRNCGCSSRRRPDGFDDEQVLSPMAGWLVAGRRDRLGPERMRFDTVIDGVVASGLAVRLGLLPGGDPGPGPSCAPSRMRHVAATRSQQPGAR